MFANTLTAHHINSSHKRDKSRNNFKRHYLQNQKFFLYVFWDLQNLHDIFRILKKKISFVATIFWKLLTTRIVVFCIPECFCFRTPFGNQRVHGSQTLTNSAWRHFYRNSSLIRGKIKLGNVSLNQI